MGESANDSVAAERGRQRARVVAFAREKRTTGRELRAMVKRHRGHPGKGGRDVEGCDQSAAAMEVVDGKVCGRGEVCRSQALGSGVERNGSSGSGIWLARDKVVHSWVACECEQGE